MVVKKSVLENKTNNELEEYIKSTTTFVPQATKFAFEILKSRGRTFSQEELKTINLLINKTEEKKTRPIHQNHIKSSNLIFISLALGLLNLILALKYIPNNTVIFSALFATIFVGIIGYLIRRGYDLKIFFLILFLIGLPFSIPSLVSELSVFQLNGLLNLSQLILQLLSIILLFTIPKKFESIKNDEFQLWLAKENIENNEK